LPCGNMVIWKRGNFRFSVFPHYPITFLHQSKNAMMRLITIGVIHTKCFIVYYRKDTLITERVIIKEVPI